MPELSGLNHLTLAVSNLERSVAFYGTVLECRLRATWKTGAYLSLGELWLCLSLDAARRAEPLPDYAPDYTHFAFSIAADAFNSFTERLRHHGVVEWKINRSEGDSFYFLDPDGHQLEAHVGDLASRLAQCRLQPYDGMRFFD